MPCWTIASRVSNGRSHSQLVVPLCTGSQPAIRYTKRALNNWLRISQPAFDASLAFEMLGFMGEDIKEGVAALKEKREPKFPSAK